jgi:hypothetical protein
MRFLFCALRCLLFPSFPVPIVPLVTFDLPRKLLAVDDALSGMIYMMYDFSFDPLGFEEPPLGITLATQNRCWLDSIAVKARFLQVVRPNPAPLTPQCFPVHSSSTPTSADHATTLDSLECSLASVMNKAVRLN